MIHALGPSLLSLASLHGQRASILCRAGLCATGRGINDRDVWIGIGEIDEARRTGADRRIDALIISIGGNDIGFAGSLTDLVKKDLVPWFGDADVRAQARAKAEEALQELPRAFDELKREIDEKLNPRKVYILEYPTGLFEKMNDDGKPIDGKPCGTFKPFLDFDLDKEDGQLVKQLGRQLNETIRLKAQEFGYIFIIGVEEDFSGHGYCDNKSFWVSAEESCRKQRNSLGMMHPNARGQEVCKERIKDALRKNMLRE